VAAPIGPYPKELSYPARPTLLPLWRSQKGERKMWFNLVVFIFCSIVAFVNWFAFPKNPKYIRAICAGLCILCALLNLWCYLSD
jgi:hypothetical protein